MRKNRFNEEQIISILMSPKLTWDRGAVPAARDRAGVLLPVEVEVRLHGRERGQALRTLEEENRQLKHIMA